MTPEELMDRRNATDRATDRRVRHSGQNLSSEAALEDLRATLEELHETEEALRQQNEELIAAQTEVAEERRRYHELFDLAPDAYLVTDLGGVIRDANRAAISLLQVKGAFLKGKALAVFIGQDDRARFRSLLSEAGSGGSGQTAAFQLQPRDRPPVAAELTYSVGLGARGQASSIRWLIRDVTDRERMAAEIQRLNRDLEARVAARTADLGKAQRLSRELIEREQSARRDAEASEAQARHVQKLESIGVLAGGIAHDFNNLLHVILGNADIALGQLPAGTPPRQALEEVVRATLRAADLTRQLLAYSGKGAFVVRNLDLSTEVREMATLLRTAISKQASLAWELSRDLPAVSADPTQIRQIVMNLITNASDALGEAGGTITLRTGVTLLEETDGEPYGALVPGEDTAHGQEGPFVYLEIGDTGAGMTPDTLSRIFDPFFSTKFSGRGLGLAAVMGIVRTHHGLIRIKTEPGRGTAFRVLFPAVPGSAFRTENPSAERIDWRGTGTVLVVDDEEGVREVAERMLQDTGFETISAADGREALDIMEDAGEEITAVLLDLSMPRMGGEEAFRRLRELRPELPVIMMSGYTEGSVARRLHAPGTGPTGFLQKPFMAEELVALLRQFAEVAG